MIEGKRCSVCKKEWNEVELFEGISGAEMVMICGNCSEREGIPTIKKPTGEQIKKTVDRSSVRERMERISGMNRTTGIGNEQERVQRNLNKLKSPIKKETNPFVLDNHYWTANMGRRRKKLTLTRSSEAMGISPQIIDEIEHGKIPENFEEIFDKMEKLYGIKLLKNRAQKVRFVKNVEEETRVLEEVKQKIDEDRVVLQEISKDDDDGESSDVHKKIKSGEIDFSNKEELKEITLNDLVEMKNKKKRVEEARRIREEIEGMIGEDLDLELSEE